MDINKSVGEKFSKAYRCCLLLLLGGASLAACSTLPPPPPQAITMQSPEYRIGAGDTLEVFVWHNQDLTVTAPVRPDGRISLPLINDIQAAGMTPTELAKNVETGLEKFVNHPVVTVIVTSFVGPYSQQVRVVGQAMKPQALLYRSHMTVLDAMIAVGGLTAYAAGDNATLVRTVNGRQRSYGLRLDDLLEDGDMSANVQLDPGDIIIIPQTYF